MKRPPALVVLAVAAATVYAAGAAVTAQASERPAPATPATATPATATRGTRGRIVEAFAPDGTISRVPATNVAPPATSSARTLATKAAAATTVTTIQNSGPSANHFDLVFMGDGYTASQQALFHQQVTAQWNAFKSREP